MTAAAAHRRDVRRRNAGRQAHARTHGPRGRLKERQHGTQRQEDHRPRHDAA
jgi:hypothetical protein